MMQSVWQKQPSNLSELSKRWNKTSQTFYWGNLTQENALILNRCHRSKQKRNRATDNLQILPRFFFFLFRCFLVNYVIESLHTGICWHNHIIVLTADDRLLWSKWGDNSEENNEKNRRNACVGKVSFHKYTVWYKSLGWIWCYNKLKDDFTKKR